MIHIQATDQNDEKVLYFLMTKGTVKCFPDNVYAVSDEQLKILDAHNIPYSRIEYGELSFTRPKAYANEKI